MKYWECGRAPTWRSCSSKDRCQGQGVAKRYPSLNSTIDSILSSPASHSYHASPTVLEQFTVATLANRALLAEEGDLLLLEVPAVFLVDQDKVEKIFHRELVVHVAEGGGERVMAAEKHADGDGFSSNRRSVHDLKLCYSFCLVECVRACACRLTLDDGYLHVLDLYPHQQEEDFAKDRVLEMELGFVVLELDVQAVLNPHLHLDGVVRFGLVSRDVDAEVLLVHHLAVLAHDSHTQKVPKAAVDSVVRFELLLYVRELERVGLRAV
mmetsp:Transcript_6904/g.17262  ORF Transcript_6904/g.17262 Transcript_6904/m.17262 type:complete len:267 (+) Transcript_6904:284-1084(+)